MEVGTLVKGEVNGLLGIITDIMEWGSQDCVRIYWITLDLHSTGWLRTRDLEVLCK